MSLWRKGLILTEYRQPNCRRISCALWLTGHNILMEFGYLCCFSVYFSLLSAVPMISWLDQMQQNCSSSHLWLFSIHVYLCMYTDTFPWSPDILLYTLPSSSFQAMNESKSNWTLLWQSHQHFDTKYRVAGSTESPPLWNNIGRNNIIMLLEVQVALPVSPEVHQNFQWYNEGQTGLRGYNYCIVQQGEKSWDSEKPYQLLFEQISLSLSLSLKCAVVNKWQVFFKCCLFSFT